MQFWCIVNPCRSLNVYYIWSQHIQGWTVARTSSIFQPVVSGSCRQYPNLLGSSLICPASTTRGVGLVWHTSTAEVILRQTKENIVLAWTETRNYIKNSICIIVNQVFVKQHRWNYFRHLFQFTDVGILNLRVSGRGSIWTRTT